MPSLKNLFIVGFVLMFLPVSFAFPSSSDIAITAEPDPIVLTRVEGIPYYSLSHPLILYISINNIPNINDFGLDSFDAKTSVDGFLSSLNCELKEKGTHYVKYKCVMEPFEITGSITDTYVLGIKIRFEYGAPSQTISYSFDKSLTLNVQKESPQPLSLSFQNAEILNNEVVAKAFHGSCTQIRDDNKPLTFYMYFSSNFLNLDYFVLNSFKLKLNENSYVDITNSLNCEKSLTSTNMINLSCVVSNFEINNVISCASYDLAVNDEITLNFEAEISYKMGENDVITSIFNVPLNVKITSVFSEEEIKTYIEERVSYQVSLDTNSMSVTTIKDTGYYLVRGVYALISFEGVDITRISDVVLRTNVFDENVQCFNDGSSFRCEFPTIEGFYGSFPVEVFINLMFSYKYDGVDFETQADQVLRIDSNSNIQEEDFSISTITYEISGEDLEGMFYNDAGNAYLLNLYDGGDDVFKVKLTVESNYPALSGNDLMFNNFRLSIMCPNGNELSLNPSYTCSYLGKEDNKAVYECMFSDISSIPFVSCNVGAVDVGDMLEYVGMITFDIIYRGEIYGEGYQSDTFNGEIRVTSLADSLESMRNVDFEIANSNIICQKVEDSTYCQVVPEGYNVVITINGISPNSDLSQYQAAFITETDQYSMQCDVLDHQELYASLGCSFEQGEVIRATSSSLSGDVALTLNLDGSDYYAVQNGVTFSLQTESVPLSYVVDEVSINIQPSIEDGGVACDVNQNYECDFANHILEISGSVSTNAPDLLPNNFGLKVQVDVGEELKEYEVSSCEFNDNLEFTCQIALDDIGIIPYISTIGVMVYYGSGDHVDELISSTTLPLVIPQELIDFYSNVSFNAEIVFLDNAIFKRADETTADLPVCIIPVSVGKYWQEYNAQHGEVSSQQIWDSLRDSYGYGNVNYDQPLCSFAGESIGVIVKVPELYHVDDFELSYIGYSLGNARDFYSATCIPLSNEDEHIERYKRGETGMTFYCMLPNLEFLMDDFTGAMPQIAVEAEVPLYLKLAIRDGKWEREGEYVTNFRFLMENSYGALTEKLNSLEEEKQYLQEQRDKINQISKRAGTAAFAVAGLDAAFGARAIKNVPVLDYLSIARYAGCFIGCKIYASTCGPDKYVVCHERCSNAAKNSGGLGRAKGPSAENPEELVVYKFCWGILDHAFVCTLGGSLLLSGAMVETLDKVEADYQEITDEIYNVEQRLQEGDSYYTIRSDLNNRFDPNAENSYHRTFLMQLNPTVSKLTGAAFSAACAYSKFFNGFTNIAKDISMESVASQFASNFISSGINAWVYGEKLTTALAGAAGGTVISVGTSALGNQLGGLGGIMDLFSSGSVIVGLLMAGMNKPEGMSTWEAMLYYWGAWSFSEGTAAIGQFTVEFGSAYWERYKIKRTFEKLPDPIKRKLMSGNIDTEVLDALKKEDFEINIKEMVVGVNRDGTPMTDKILVVRKTDSHREFALRIDDQGVHVGGYRIVSNERMTGPVEVLKEDDLNIGYSGQANDGVVTTKDFSSTNRNPSQPSTSGTPGEVHYTGVPPGEEPTTYTNPAK